LGAAYLAGLAVGLWKNVDELRQYWAVDKAFEPSLPEEKRKEFQKNWKRAVKAAMAWSEE